jgi:hypothetical protein
MVGERESWAQRVSPPHSPDLEPALLERRRYDANLSTKCWTTLAQDARRQLVHLEHLRLWVHEPDMLDPRGARRRSASRSGQTIPARVTVLRTPGPTRHQCTRGPRARSHARHTIPRYREPRHRHPGEALVHRRRFPLSSRRGTMPAGGSPGMNGDRLSWQGTQVRDFFCLRLIAFARRSLGTAKSQTAVPTRRGAVATIRSADVVGIRVVPATSTVDAG